MNHFWVIYSLGDVVGMDLDGRRQAASDDWPTDVTKSEPLARAALTLTSPLSRASLSLFRIDRIVVPAKHEQSRCHHRLTAAPRSQTCRPHNSSC
jgi:hypothetical protein